MAITYGMSVKEFWEDDPDLFWAYRFSYYNKMKIQQEIFNNDAWLQGAYFHEAVSVALCNAFSKKKVQYSEHPYTAEKNKEQEQKNAQEALVAKLKARVAQVQAIKGRKQQEIIEGESRENTN